MSSTDTKKTFKKMDTAYMQNKYFKERGLLVEPKEYTIGVRQSYHTDKRMGMNAPRIEVSTGQFISIREMLQAYLKNEDYAKMATDSKEHDGSVLKSYFDGKKWQRERTDNTINLRFYGDDIEPANPIGSHKTLYKIGCIYYQCESLPNWLLSKTENTLLALCYYAEDVKDFGWEKVLAPLLRELKHLEEHGLAVQLGSAEMNFKVCVSVFTGDNLFLNSILGFVESFSANFPCRHCIVPKADFQTTFIESASSIRTRELHEEHVKAASVSQTGVKANCALNILESFHSANNYVQDVMHDIFEGVCTYDMRLICRHIIDSGYVTLQVLNSRIQSFNFGYYEMKDKPPLLTKSVFENEQLSMDAVQAWCFVRVFSLAVGDLIPSHDRIWTFYLTLRQIMDIICAPEVYIKELDMLTVLIAEYLEIRKSLFPAQSLKNKHHHMIHYPRLISEAGPLSRFWCLRFEAKHQRPKKLMHMTGNFKNVAKSIAMRHQLDFAYVLMRRSSELLAYKKLVVGPGSVTKLQEFQDGSVVNDVLGNIGMHCEILHAKWIEFNGVRYKPGFCVLTAVQEDILFFVKICYIFVRNDDIVWMYGLRLQSKGFNAHYHAWEVCEFQPRQFTFADPKCLRYPFPLAITEKMMEFESHYTSFISLKYRV